MTEAVDAAAAAPQTAAGHDAPSGRDAAPGAPAGDDAAPAADIFAQRRTELGLSLEEVANQLKFSARQIGALEAGEFDKLPGGTFARGMMRSYARLLKLEPGQFTAQLTAAGAAHQVALEQAVSLRAPIPFSEGGKHVNLVYSVLSVLLLAIVAFLAVQWYQEKNAATKLAFVKPVSPIAPGAGAQAQPAEAPGGQSTEPAALASADAPPVAGTRSPAAEKSAAEKPAAITAAMTSTATSAATSSGPGKRRIVLRFQRESWVEIKAARGIVLMSQLNPAGTEKVIEGDPPFELTIGNAPNVRLTYNDQPVDLKPYLHVDVARLTLN